MTVRRAPRWILLPVDLALMAIALLVADLLRQVLGIAPLGERGPWLAGPSIYFVALCVWLFSAFTHGVYQAPYGRSFREELLVTGRALLTAYLTLAGLLYLTFRDVSRLLFLYFCLIDGVLLLGFRLSAARWLDDASPAGGGPRRILIVGTGAAAARLAALVTERDEECCEIVGFLSSTGGAEVAADLPGPVLGDVSQAAALVSRLRIDDLVFAVPIRDDARHVRVALEVEAQQARVWVLPEQFEWAFSNVTVDVIAGVPVVGLGEPPLATFDRLVKRAFDVVVAAVLLVVLSPLFAVIALLIRLDSPGPAVFSQQRVGENWKLFQMYKFRTMYSNPDAELTGKLAPAAEAMRTHKRSPDPRVTRIGRFLRRTSLDELPQLWNVLKGDMSLVGPRPELPYLAELYEPWQWGRFSVPQGMTGWWQIHGRAERPMHLHTEDDLYYVRHYSLLMDIRILLKTVGAVFSGRGAF